MPYKTSIIPFLDEVDPLVKIIGACNNVYLTKEGNLRGTNTDWRGVKGCLISGDGGGIKGKGKPALIIGAGGASRAAVYALSAEMGCEEIYVVNRDKDEVAALMEDVKRYDNFDLRQPKLVQVTSVEQAKNLSPPYYIVGTVPDFEAKTEEELLARAILERFLGSEEKGVILDMCYKPMNTRTLKLARQKGWTCVDGTKVIGYQLGEQWRLWTGAGEDGKKGVSMGECWEILRREAESSKAINF